jgi:hypothetical protein
VPIFGCRGSLSLTPLSRKFLSFTVLWRPWLYHWTQPVPGEWCAAPRGVQPATRACSFGQLLGPNSLAESVRNRFLSGTGLRNWFSPYIVKFWSLDGLQRRELAHVKIWNLIFLMFYLYVCPILILIIHLSSYTDHDNTINCRISMLTSFLLGGGGVDSVLTEEELGGPLSLRE